ncbi:MAG: hypothetical protein COV44_02495 [Deltaproteobacteria bacterium CG11_big_fil_rev_8_21_14_0_20_45_16]|nr:MAG: hypothetical protein COV44_02495 [Deltaproteobacteria bacterium CG11_big_fil_rev_8_21_14_0_20_45_16]
MARRELTVAVVEEIRRRLEGGRSVREIARALKCSRETVRRVRDGEVLCRAGPRESYRPWLDQVDWACVVEEFRLGHPLKFIWEERILGVTSYPNFWKAFYQKYPALKSAAVTPREFTPGERCEVDYAGGKIPWVNLKTGQVYEASVFVSVLGSSQLLFATAKEDMKSRNFLECHREMYEVFQGVPHVTVPDCLKTGVSKCHLYDPDINAAYAELAKHYGTAVVPARPKRPKDKALVEGAVRIVMRYFRWRYRPHTFVSVAEINRALREATEFLNQRPHSRFGVSRRERFEKLEKEKLKPLPSTVYEIFEYKDAKLHPDSHVFVEKIYYSAPHIYRGQTLRVKLSLNLVEIYHGLERVAVHPRCRSRDARRVTTLTHLPDNARAYREATPQNLLSQARFLSHDLHELFKELFEADALGHLRRAQGFIREARKEIELLGHDKARSHLQRAIHQMRAVHKIRVPYLRELLNRYQKQTYEDGDREIQRDLSNPLLRYNTQEEIHHVDCTTQKSLPRNEAPRLPFISRSNLEGGHGRGLEPA